jgi:hypothetical protein
LAFCAGPRSGSPLQPGLLSRPGSAPGHPSERDDGAGCPGCPRCRPRPQMRGARRPGDAGVRFVRRGGRAARNEADAVESHRPRPRQSAADARRAQSRRRRRTFRTSRRRACAQRSRCGRIPRPAQPRME